MAKANSIVVTHFINPHLFWYYNINACKEKFQILNRIERELESMCKEKCKGHFQLGNQVVTLYLRWNKYIRTEVLYQSNEEDEFIVWATDYGFPFLANKSTMYSIPPVEIRHSNHIRRGGISGIVPNKFKCTCDENSLQEIACRSWSQEVCDVLERKLSDASLITFVEDYQTPGITKHYWGNIIITTPQGENINIVNYLLDEKREAEVCSKFKNLIRIMKTIKIPPWMSNDRKSKFKKNFIPYDICNPNKKKINYPVDSLLRRKVYEWNAHNARQLLNETPITESDDSGKVSINDIEFDDSVSFISMKQRECQQQQLNKKHHNDNNNYKQNSITNKIHVNGNNDKYEDERRFKLLNQKNFINKLARITLKDRKQFLEDAKKIYCPKDEHFIIRREN